MVSIALFAPRHQAGDGSQHELEKSVRPDSCGHFEEIGLSEGRVQVGPDSMWILGLTMLWRSSQVCERSSQEGCKGAAVGGQRIERLQAAIDRTFLVEVSWYASLSRGSRHA